MTIEEKIDKLMNKRGFSLMAKSGTGIRMYSYSDIKKTPRVMVEVIPERREFKVTYGDTSSINTIQTPWCSPINDKEHFWKILNGVLEWARKLRGISEE